MTAAATTSDPRPLSEIGSYHAHIYYDPAATRAEAERLRAWIGERFSVTLGRWHDVKVGPHDQAMYQVAFAREVFPELVPWLMLNHGNLSVLIHPNTTNPRRDHLADPIWIGPALAVHADKLPEHAEMEEAPAPNTTPVLRPERGPAGRESRPGLPLHGLNPWISPVMMAASACLDYALLWFALWWDLFGESIRNQT